MTAWNDFLAREGATLDNHAATFAGAPADGAALDTGAVAVPLVHLGLLHSIGPDSEVFLHNLFSNDVGNLAPQAVQWSSFNSPKGRMLANFLAWRASEGHHLLLAADIAQMMAKKLSMYILRSKVKLVDISAERALVGVAGVHAGSCLQRAGLPLPAADMQQTVADGIEVIRLDAQRFIVICAADAGAALFSRLTAAGAIKAGTDTWQLAMIRAGIPLITSATQEEFVAQMLNYELIGGVTFQKRCYPGQEIVARTQYLGKLKKRMYRVALPPGLQPQAGNDLYSPAFGEQSAGKLVNVVPVGNGFEALAVLQSSCAESGEVHYGTTDGPVLSFLDLPYPLP